MTALAQGASGVALVMAFALLTTRQLTGAALLLAVQSAAVALSAAALQRPLMAMPPVLLSAGIWMIWHRPTNPLHAGSAPRGGAKLGIAAGAILAVLSQSLGDLALPAAIVLLSILLAVTRSQPWMQVIALAGAQNGIALAGSIIALPALLPHALTLPFACIILPLPLVFYLLRPTGVLRRLTSRRTQWTPKSRQISAVAGWLDLALALAIGAGAVLVPLDGIATVFAPLIALDGLIKAVVRRNRLALPPARRGAALLQTASLVLAVSTPDLGLAWLAVFGAIAATLLPAASRRWDTMVLAFVAASVALLGMFLLPGPGLISTFAAHSSGVQSIIGYFSWFAGFAFIAGAVPELAPVLVVLVVRLAIQSPWPPYAEALGSAIAVTALLSCAIMLTMLARPHRITLLLLSQASIAALSLCTGQPDGRFAAFILLMLLILTRSSARISHGLPGRLALAGLAGVPPLGVFPALVLVLLTLSAHEPWLLLPIGVAFIPSGLASMPGGLASIASGVAGVPSGRRDPTRRPGFRPRPAVPSIAWIPLTLAILAGYFAPDRLVDWLRLVTAGPS